MSNVKVTTSKCRLIFKLLLPWGNRGFWI